ncbi:uncharacterized protein stbd1 [Triplophysa rosa]|uniref:Starch-binding domain-containing protein 1 n=1 Tax=Triplophysa rosa TaxID=992332 RepID=A0A9W7TFC7_TRIRA|nr:uncharacterized protein stbd1 [Triplophysa rosa]KAI7795716.1 putative starch-binding domain-containing protein 1 [Triplophysa rosa]
MKHSKPIALDRHEIHVLLDLIGGYGVAVAVGILAMLSVCAAFFIYRSVGQRGKACENNGSETTAATEDGSERGDQPTETESTGEYQEAKTCCSESESTDDINLLASDNILLPTDVSEKDLNESTLRDLEEITDELLTELELESEGKTDSDLDQCMEMDPDKPDDKLESEDHSEHEDAGRECVEDICEALADVNVQFTRLDETDEPVKEETEEHLKDHDKSETGLSLSLDRYEPSETESAQEIIYKRHQDVIACTTQEDDLHGHVFTAQSKYISDQAVDPSTDKIRFEVDHKNLTMEENTKTKFEDHHDWRFPRTKDLDCCCYDKKTDMEEKMKCRPWFHCGSPDVDTLIKHHSNRFDYPLQNYLGFQTDSSFIGGSSTQVSLSGERKSDEDGVAMEKKHERKNEISIMDAIMDNNEWLNVGGQEFRDLPWLTQTATSASSIDENRAKEGKEEIVVTLKDSLAKEDEELANKRVATVQPLPQQVHVTFRIHYITYSSSQLVAVTGSLQELGAWESFVPLHGAKDGFWANTITLPMESQVEWKFVLVEDGKICRWEECGNRYLVFSGQDEELYLNKCWGCI